MKNSRENIGLRIKQFRKDKNLSVPQLEKITGIPKDRIYKWEKETTPYDTADYETIERLLKGGLESLETTPLHHAPTGKFPKQTRSDAPVQFYDVAFSAGEGIEFYNDGDANRQPDYLMDIPDFAGCIAFRAYGDSMEQIIHPGDILFATLIEAWQSHLEYGQIYAVVCGDNRRYLKYIRKSKKEATHFLLRSENKDYDDFLLPREAIRQVWLIHGWMNKRL